jgi:hypothetical protein
MTALAMTRLIDLVDGGYQIDRHHSSGDRLVLEHTGRGPGIELMLSGMILARDGPLWRGWHDRSNSIRPGDDRMFDEFLFAIEPPRRFQEMIFCLRRAMSLLPMVATFRRWARSIRWFAIEQFR